MSVELVELAVTDPERNRRLVEQFLADKRHREIERLAELYLEATKTTVVHLSWDRQLSLADLELTNAATAERWDEAQAYIAALEGQRGHRRWSLVTAVGVEVATVSRLASCSGSSCSSSCSAKSRMSTRTRQSRPRWRTRTALVEQADLRLGRGLSTCGTPGTSRRACRHFHEPERGRKAAVRCGRHRSSCRGCGRVSEAR